MVVSHNANRHITFEHLNSVTFPFEEKSVVTGEFVVLIVFIEMLTWQKDKRVQRRPHDRKLKRIPMRTEIDLKLTSLPNGIGSGKVVFKSSLKLLFVAGQVLINAVISPIIYQFTFRQ